MEINYRIAQAKEQVKYRLFFSAWDVKKWRAELDSMMVQAVTEDNLQTPVETDQLR